MDSDPTLRRLYRWANDTFFGGELRDDTEVWWQPSAKALALTFALHPGDQQLGITIDPCIHGLRRITKLTMAHECVHVKLWPLGERVRAHGKRFDAEIQRLTTYKQYRRLL